MNDFSLRKTDRILKRREFERLSKVGKRIHYNHFIAVFSANELHKVRLGLTVSKKVGNSVTRNRVKRMVREHFRIEKANLSGSYDINIIARPNAAQVLPCQAQVELTRMFRQVVVG